MLYGSECGMVKKADVQQIDALDQWRLRRILDIHWHDLVRNDAVCWMTQQPPLSSVVKSHRLSLFGHVARMNELADTNPEDSQEATLHLDSKCLQWPVLMWQGAARSQGGSSEPTFLADVNEAQRYATVAVHSHIELDCDGKASSVIEIVSRWTAVPNT